MKAEPDRLHLEGKKLPHGDILQPAGIKVLMAGQLEWVDGHHWSVGARPDLCLSSDLFPNPSRRQNTSR